MVKCLVCEQEMLHVDGCVKHRLESKGTRYEVAPYELDFPHEPDFRCHDCNCKVGEYHHPGCDMEECPKCGGQLISCSCFNDSTEVVSGDENEQRIKELEQHLQNMITLWNSLHWRTVNAGAHQKTEAKYSSEDFKRVLGTVDAAQKVLKGS